MRVCLCVRSCVSKFYASGNRLRNREFVCARDKHCQQRPTTSVFTFARYWQAPLGWYNCAIGTAFAEIGRRGLWPPLNKCRECSRHTKAPIPTWFYSRIKFDSIADGEVNQSRAGRSSVSLCVVYKGVCHCVCFLLPGFMHKQKEDSWKKVCQCGCVCRWFTIPPTHHQLEPFVCAEWTVTLKCPLAWCLACVCVSLCVPCDDPVLFLNPLP